MAAAHLNRESKDPRGGHIERDAAGNPNGALRDNASSFAGEVMPPDSEAHEVSLLAAAFADMRAVGITSVQDAAADDHSMTLYRRLYDEHRLGMRVRASMRIQDLSRPAAEVLKEAEAFRKRWSIDPDFLRADAVKIFADGVIEYPSQTAALLEPYLDANGKPTANRGPDYFTQQGLDEIVAAIDAAGFTVHIHAIGDRGVRSALDAFAAARTANGGRDNRDQIAHLELIDPKDFPRFKQLDVIANFQLLWAQRDPSYIDGATVPYLGAERSRYLYPAKSVADAGGMIAGGSDWGVSSFNAFIAMEHGITRSEKRGNPPLLPEQALTIDQVVDAYTVNAAMALKQEKTTGSLEVGKRADLIVLDRDIFAIDPYELHATQVLSTWLDGREVYKKVAAKPRKAVD
jgi:predicted amidohydrolase YtcJ